MKVVYILLAALIIIAIAVGLKGGFTNGLLTLGIGLIPVAIFYSIENSINNDDW